MKAKNCEKRDILTVDKRQKSILNELEQSNQPIVARKLAEKFSVSRQIIVVLRALSQVIFAVVGAKIIESRNLMDTIDDSKVKSQLFSFSIALIHALGETLVVTVFFYGGLGLDNSQGFFYTVFLLVGVGTLVHSMVDFLLAQYIWKAQKSRLMDLKLRIV